MRGSCEVQNLLAGPRYDSACLPLYDIYSQVDKQHLFMVEVVCNVESSSSRTYRIFE